MDHLTHDAERRSPGSGGSLPVYRVEGNGVGPAPPAPGTEGIGDPWGSHPGPAAPYPRWPTETWVPLRPGPPPAATPGAVPPQPVRPPFGPPPGLPPPGLLPPGLPPPAGATPDRSRNATRPRRRRRLRRLLKASAAIMLLQLAAILSLNWFTPPTTAFMLQNDAEFVVQETVGVEHVSRNFLAAVLIHEDDRLPYRFLAFDVPEFWDRTTTYLRGEPDDSGSTIPQQLAKNLFLTPEQDGFRKGLEAGLAMELSVLVSDARILELYVNYAQFGPNLYGICAASWYYFGTAPDTIELAQAAQLAGLLPSPLHVQRGPDGGLDFDVPDGSGELSAKHVWRAEEQVPYWFERTGGWQPVWDLGIEGFAQDQPDTADDCSEMPAEVAALIASGQ